MEEVISIRYLNMIDPFFFLLRKILASFFKASLNDEENRFVEDNLLKHRRVLWINAICTGLVIWSLQSVSKESLYALITALLAPVMVMGGAWFAMSFGAIPAKLISISMSVTSWMFIAFSVSLSAMIVAVCFISPFQLWPVWLIIYLGALISCIQYDTADGLKSGLDEAMLYHSRAALIYYEKNGIRVEPKK